MNSQITTSGSLLKKEDKMQENMIVLTRTFDLLSWLLPKSEKFPRIYRYTLTQRIITTALDFQDTLIVAQACRGRERIKSLRLCDTKLMQLRVYLRLIHQWQWLRTQDQITYGY